MKIKVSDIASHQLTRIVHYYASHFSLQAADNLIDSFEEKMKYLSKYPEAGHPEPLAVGLIPLYRCIRIAKHINVIYYIDYLEDSIMVSDLWDTRMNPNTLRARLSKKRKY